MLAARKINDEINIFSGVFTNPMFISIWIIIVVAQAFIVQVGGKALKCHINGLTKEQWVYCLIGGVMTLPFNVILKFVPDRIFPTLGDEDPNDVVVAAAEY